ncbi:MAG: IS1634 family transposase [Cyanothece sp. SIO2G6]|nr:IS1634 family transposase [Cyanothece sp. SIO2G6]
MSPTEGWADVNKVLLQGLSGQYGLCGKDFTDDRLEQALDYLSEETTWLAISNDLNSRGLSVYQWESYSTVRLDAAPMQGHHQVKEGGLFQYGYSKHHNGNLGQFKVKLGNLDHGLHGLGYPLAHLVVSGEQADDTLYLPIIDQCEATLAHAGHVARKLYVGDGKMGSKQIRDYIVLSGNDYLVPLSETQLSSAQRVAAIESVDASGYQKVYKTDPKGHEHLVAQGFERVVTRSYIDQQGKEKQYAERQIFILSSAYAHSARKALDRRVDKAVEILEQLLIPKKGKQLPKTEEELTQKIADMLASKRIKGLIEVKITAQEHRRTVRAYKQRPAREEISWTFEMEIQRDHQAIEARKQTLGWQVYATNAASERLSLEACVWKYRAQNRVESRFNDLRNKVVPLLPVFLKKDHRIEALVHLLMICLKICAGIEYKIAHQLSQDKQKLDQIFEGNPKKSTATPTAKRILNQFKGISIVIIALNTPQDTQVIMTPLLEIQSKILDLCGWNDQIYLELAHKIHFCLARQKISEN